MKTIRVGSRESRLAVVQSELVMDAIRAAHPEVGLELVTMKTTGDKILDRTLDKVGGKGLFVKELDAALLDGRVDLTVHSCKDLPMEEDPRIPLAGFSRREDPRDVLVLPQGAEELVCGYFFFFKPLLTDTQVLYLLARVRGKSNEACFVHIRMYSIECCKVGLQLVDVFSDR